jgi:hypothetical protein
VDWQPIETAPQDGTAFLVWMDAAVHGSHVQVWCRRSAKHSGVIAGVFEFDLGKSPTHWMPLPAPPTDKTG